jgi:two-component system, NarL family, invasion response regulator UvrY
MNTSVAIVDDHHLLAQALSDLIQKFEGFEVLFVAGNGRELLSCLNRRQIPDLLLLDLNMPEMDGFETADYLQQHHPDIRVLALSMFDREDQIARMIQLGARGYLLKGCSPSELRLALTDVKTRGFHYSEFLTNQLVKNLKPADGHAGPAPVRLNARELEFLRLSCSDLTYADIADRMCVATRTVDGYREALFQKLKVKSRVGMALEAVRQGLVELSMVVG